MTVETAISAHRAAHAARRAMDADDDVSDEAYDAADTACSDALKALARAPCGSEEGFARKLRYLIAWSHADEHDPERLIAVRTAVEGWLEEAGARG